MTDCRFTRLKHEDNAFLLNDANSSLKSYYQAYAVYTDIQLLKLHCVSDLQKKNG